MSIGGGRSVLGCIGLLLASGVLVVACGSSSAATGPGTGADGPDASVDGSNADGATDATSGDAATDGGDAAHEGGSDADVDAGPLALFHFSGRVDTTSADGPRFGWSGTEVRARFDGTGISVTLVDQGPGGSDADLVSVSIDGGAATVLTLVRDTPMTYPLASGLAAGLHDVVVTKRTEGFQGTIQFRGFTVADGALVATPSPFTRRIEVVGDSISAGYGDEGVAPCPFTPQTENAVITYGFRASRTLAAEPSIVAFSGIGAYRDSNGGTSNQMPVLFERTIVTDTSATWSGAPATDVVVINLGTNDFATGDPGQPFVDAYVGLIKQLRTHYANADILCLTSPLLDDNSPNPGSMARTKEATYIHSAITTATAAGVKNVSFLDITEQDDARDGAGCDSHPNGTTQGLMATQLVNAIKTLKGW